MMRTDNLTYDDFMELSLKYYNNGGDVYYECWDKTEFFAYVQKCGPMTEKKALAMFKLNKAIEKEMEGWF